MGMTHYMELLATNQPWNLILFMAIPIVLAETVAITELYILFTRNMAGTVRGINRAAGVAVGIYFVGIIGYLLVNAVVPITRAGEWRTIADVIAVGTYLLAGVPLVMIALQDLGVVSRSKTDEQKLMAHAIYVAAFLVLGHVAMVFGMLDPAVFGWTEDMHSMH